MTGIHDFSRHLFKGHPLSVDAVGSQGNLLGTTGVLLWDDLIAGEPPRVVLRFDSPSPGKVTGIDWECAVHTVSPGRCSESGHFDIDVPTKVGRGQDLDLTVKFEFINLKGGHIAV